MFTALAIVAAIIGIIWTRKTEIIVHDPLDGAAPPSGERPASPLHALERAVQAARDEAARQAEDEDLDVSEMISHEDIVDLVREGKHIEALKLYREATGADLATAKGFIDKLRGQ